MRHHLRAPVKKSSRRAGNGTAALTIRELEITRGRDRNWERSQDVIYLSFYATRAHADRQQATAEIALDYADARMLMKLLREELMLERAATIRRSITVKEKE